MDEQTSKLLNRAFILSAILVVGVLVFFVGEIGLQDRSIDQQNQNQITVSGEGKVYAKPDVALVSLGVTSQAATVVGVTSKNSTQMNAVLAALKALKIDDKDIQTTNYSLTPVYEDYTYPTPAPVPVYSPDSGAVSGSGTMVKSGSTLTGYKLEQDVQVKIRDFTKIGDVFSQSTTAGANMIGDLQFTIDNPDQYKEQARAQAISQAKADAQNLAKESGISLGKIINVYEGYTPVPLSYNAMGAGMSAKSESVVSPVIQPGQQEIDVTINLTYKVN